MENDVSFCVNAPKEMRVEFAKLVRDAMNVNYPANRGICLNSEAYQRDANGLRHAFLEGRPRPFRNRVDAVVLPLSFLTREISSSVVTRALMDGTSIGDFPVRSGERENVRPSFRRISTLPDTSALSSTLASFCRASEYV
jgi:hypothetical protein